MTPDAARTVLEGVVVACIGATTAGGVRHQGWRVDLVAEDTTTEALVAALAAHLVPAPSMAAERVA
jgi:uroporphyrinogen-III synthase